MGKYNSKYTINIDNTYQYNYRLTPVALLMLIQNTFAKFLTTKHLGAFHLISANLIWVITEINIEMMERLPFWSEDIDIEIWVSELSSLKVYTDYNVYYKGKIIARGNMLWLLIDKDSKRPYRVDQFIEKLEPYDELVLGKHNKFILPEQTDKVVEIMYTTNYADIDINNHVNNKSYIRIAEMTAPDVFIHTHIPKTLKVKFNKETFLGDTLKCEAFTTQAPNVYVHKITKDDVPVCDIETSWVEQNDDIAIQDYELDLIKNN